MTAAVEAEKAACHREAGMAGTEADMGEDRKAGRVACHKGAGREDRMVGRMEAKAEMALADMAGRMGTAVVVGMADMAGTLGTSGILGRAGREKGRMAGTAGMEGKEAWGAPGKAGKVGREAWGLPGREVADRAGRVALAEGRGDMDLVSEDLGDPTSNRRRRAGTAACSNSSSRLYYGIRRSNSCPLGCTAPAGGTAPARSSHCSRNIHLALAWNRILSSKALRARPW